MTKWTKIDVSRCLQSKENCHKCEWIVNVLQNCLQVFFHVGNWHSVWNCPKKSIFVHFNPLQCSKLSPKSLILHHWILCQFCNRKLTILKTIGSWRFYPSANFLMIFAIFTKYEFSKPLLILKYSLVVRDVVVI